MAWKCSRCGTDNDDAQRLCHGMCGYVRYGRLVLSSVATGKEVRFNVDALVGKTLLWQIVGDHARYLGDPQFGVSRNRDRASWVITHCVGSVNPTRLNGSQIGPEGAELGDGGEITIGADKAKLRVRIEV